MSGIIGSKLNIRGSGRIAKLGTDGQVLTSSGPGVAANYEDAAGGGLDWQTVVTASTFTAVAGNGYPVNTTSNACTVTLPASASVGDEIIFTDYARNWGTNALTINQNSLNYQGGAVTNPVYDTNNESVHIVYMDATQGWIPTYDGAVSYETNVFNGTVDYLVIAGGGGGGGATDGSSYGGGGGGAGGYRNSFNSEASGGGGSSETAETQTTGTTYTIVVGAGGTGTVMNAANPDDAEDSSFIGTGISITSAGGGGGGSRNQNSDDAYAGGCGGGTASTSTTVAAGTSNQGYGGGISDDQRGTGGGGGAGAVGVNGVTGTGGTGGVGVASDITGSTVTRSGGGGGSGDTIGAGGTGGGGAGGKCNVTAVAGTANTGGGGGGGGQADTCADNSAGAGGSGVVIIRMDDTDYSSSTGSPTVATGQGAGSDETILTFTGDGTYTTV
jgi:hypothetical protein